MQQSPSTIPALRKSISTLLTVSFVLIGSLGCGASLALAQGEPSEAEKMQLADYIRQGDRHYAEENYEAAIASYTQALETFRLHAYAYYQRANAYRQLENYEAAVNDYTQALQLNPNNQFALQYRGLSLAAMGNREAAIADYTELIRRNPKDAKAYHLRGDAYAALNHHKAALEDYQEALKLYQGARNYRAYSAIQQQIRAVKQKQ